MERSFVDFVTFATTATVLTFTTCSSDNSGDDNGNGNGGNGGGTGSSIVVGENILSGTLTGKQALDARECILNGAVIITDSGHLNIPAGTTIKTREGSSSYLLVMRGGGLYANGAADKPIVFTANTTSPVSGYWDSVIVNGKALTSGSETDKNDTALTEINNDYRCGGNAAGGNSDSLTYVKVYYAGAHSIADIEHNGLTLGGVGNETEIENIYVLKSTDDTVRLFGGIVSATNLLAVNPNNDMFDFTQGYCGTSKSYYGVWESNYINTEADPRDIKASGNMDGLYPDHPCQSDFKVEGITIVNNTASTTDNVDRVQDVTKIRRGTKATITNVLVKSTGGAIDLVGMKDSKGAGNIESNINITSTLSLTGLKQNGELNTFVESTDNTGADTSLFGWTGYNLSAF